MASVFLWYWGQVWPVVLLRQCGGRGLAGNLGHDGDPPDIRISELVGSGRSRVLGLNCGFSALASHRMRGSWVVSIHPRAQSILGWFAANHGYPRITLWCPRSVRKKRMLVCLVPICTCRST